VKVQQGNLPAAEFQLEFLKRLQRIVSDGKFTATYKFALLQALADIAVEAGKDDIGELTFSTTLIAEKFLDYYWRQSEHYPVIGGDPKILRQNSKGQAQVLSIINGIRSQGFRTLGEARKSLNWNRATIQVRAIVEDKPLRHLQVVGRTLDPFFYRPLRSGTHEIALQSGVDVCFRLFHPLVLELARGGWLRQIRTINAQDLPETVGLYEFCFGNDRQPLAVYRGLLEDIQKGVCFYCGGGLTNPEVDHFIPRVSYPVDLAHNFVLADKGCNNQKRDFLAVEYFHKKWQGRNREHTTRLRKYFDDNALPHNLTASEQIADWAYGRAGNLGVKFWSPKGWKPEFAGYSETTIEHGMSRAAEPNARREKDN
jgi:hypothetical protein